MKSGAQGPKKSVKTTNEKHKETRKEVRGHAKHGNKHRTRGRTGVNTQSRNKQPQHA